MRSDAEYQALFEQAEGLRAEAERQTHRANSFEHDMGRVEELKEKVTALTWENAKQKDDLDRYRLETKYLRELAVKVQRGELVPAAGAKVPQKPMVPVSSRTEVEKLRDLIDGAEPSYSSGQVTYEPAPVSIREGE